MACLILFNSKIPWCLAVVLHIMTHCCEAPTNLADQTTITNIWSISWISSEYTSTIYHQLELCGSARIYLNEYIASLTREVTRSLCSSKFSRQGHEACSKGTSAHQQFFTTPTTMSYIYYANDCEGDSNFTNTTSTRYFPDLLTESEDPDDEFLSINEIDWDNPALYTMPLTSDEIAALTSNTTATNNTPQLPTPSLVTNSHPDLPATPPVTTSNSPPDIPPGEPSETHSLSHESSEPLRQANSSSWAARNPTHPIILLVHHRPRLTDAQKASRKIKRDQKIERMKRLHDAKTKIEALSRAHNVTPKQINNIIGSQTHYRTSRKSQLINALVHAKAMEVNVDLPAGSRYSLAELATWSQMTLKQKFDKGRKGRSHHGPRGVS
ncbi:uncharacterized protein F5891DRAFT_989457 [Suillus fuscotomentosus]|uniref:Uncharacterized protein n=1 Tax=Suillus fuscotomentosus TaxID=1912939 RepID=A0AAD4DND1_9AGAM|nr:uncharacterized protein F5891DRAFT_989457 [Suillus fuscotomentosus]KAG1885847.1 hypothetical protein F5891DRAFT_989457 [Suillus fuscotomentosus]